MAHMTYEYSVLSPAMLCTRRMAICTPRIIAFHSEMEKMWGKDGHRSQE